MAVVGVELVRKRLVGGSGRGDHAASGDAKECAA